MPEAMLSGQRVLEEQKSKLWLQEASWSSCGWSLGHICTLGLHFLDSSWMFPHESHTSRAPHPGQHAIVSAERPQRQRPDPPWLLQRGQWRCHVSWILQSGGSSSLGPPAWLGRHACLQGLTHCLQFFASLSHQSWEILSVMQRGTDDHSGVCLR